jgi:hypothetical protein
LKKSFSSKVAEALSDGRDEGREAFADGARIAGEVDDEAAAAGAGGGAGEDGGGDLGKTHGAHRFTEAGEFAIKDGSGGLGREVARGGAGAAGGHDEVAAFVIAESSEEGGKTVPIIGYETGEDGVVGAQVLAEHALDLGSAEVGVDAGGGAVAQGDAGDAEDGEGGGFNHGGRGGHGEEDERTDGGNGVLKSVLSVALRVLRG